MVLNALQSCSGINECMWAQNWELFNITRDSRPGRVKRQQEKAPKRLATETPVVYDSSPPVSDALA